MSVTFVDRKVIFLHDRLANKCMGFQTFHTLEELTLRADSENATLHYSYSSVTLDLR